MTDEKELVQVTLETLVKAQIALDKLVAMRRHIPEGRREEFIELCNEIGLHIATAHGGVSALGGIES